MNLSNLGTFGSITNDQSMLESWLDNRSRNLTGTERAMIPSSFSEDIGQIRKSDTILYGSDLSIDELIQSVLTELAFSNNLTSVTSNSLSAQDHLSTLFRKWLESTLLQAVPEGTKNTLKDQIDFVAQISNAEHHETIFEIFDTVEFREISSRLRYLHEITQDFDPEDPPMELESLRQFALFCVSDGNSLPNFEIGISPNGGFLQIEWSSNRASALMKFLPDGNISICRNFKDRQQEYISEHSRFGFNRSCPASYSTVHH